jgi:hypothetical protein
MSFTRAVPHYSCSLLAANLTFSIGLWYGASNPSLGALALIAVVDGRVYAMGTVKTLRKMG